MPEYSTGREESYEMVGIIPAEVQLSGEEPEGHGYVIIEVIV